MLANRRREGREVEAGSQDPLIRRLTRLEQPLLLLLSSILPQAPSLLLTACYVLSYHLIELILTTSLVFLASLDLTFALDLAPC